MAFSLNWSKTASDGSARSIVSQILDPVGACIQPADLSPWDDSAVDAPAAPAATEV